MRYTLEVEPFDSGFMDTQANKALALKPLEEAAEAFGAWQRYNGDEWDDTDGDLKRMLLDDIADELADTVQACVNLADREGLDLSAALARVHGRNVGRGRCGLRQCCDSAATEVRSDCEEGANDSRTGANDSRTDGAGGVSTALRALESPDWPQLTLAVLGRNGTRREVVQRLAAMLDQRAGRDGREKPDGDANTGKRGLTEREREILDMWPKFEDGEPVMIGDESTNNKNQRFTVKRIEFRHGKWMLNDSVTDGHYLNGKSGKRVKRPATKVLDADGVEIKVGDTVWHHSGLAHGVVTSIDAGSLMGTVRYVNGGVGFRDAAKDLTHTRPDSWERMEEDAVKGACEYTGAEPTAFDAHDCDTCRFYGEHSKLICEQLMALDIVRRAKALAGAEVAE